MKHEEPKPTGYAKALFADRVRAQESEALALPVAKVAPAHKPWVADALAIGRDVPYWIAELPNEAEFLSAMALRERAFPRTAPTVKLQASAGAPVTVYYCKAGIKTGLTVRVMQGGKVHETAIPRGRGSRAVVG